MAEPKLVFYHILLVSIGGFLYITVAENRLLDY